MTEIMRWEYRVQTIGGVLRGVKDEDFEALLNEWGEEGWEVISVTLPENTNKVKIVAKRPLTTAARRRRTLPESFTRNGFVLRVAYSVSYATRHTQYL